MLPIAPGIVIEDAEIKERFIRSSGPGGQNVNKVSTAVQLRFDVARSPSLPEPVKQRLLRTADSRLTGDGWLVITAGRFRTRERNREDARHRLADWIRKALVPPETRRATRPSGASRQRRLETKRRRSMLKGRRRKPTATEG